MLSNFGKTPPVQFAEKEVGLRRSIFSDYMKLHGTKDATTVITPESADALLKRGLKPSKCGSGFVYSRDLKLMARGVYGYPFDVWSEFAKAIVCPHLIVTAKSKPGYFAEGRSTLCHFGIVPLITLLINLLITDHFTDYFTYH
jgi:hypothetical protein